MTTANVLLWGSKIGAVTWREDQEIGIFQYYPDFIRSQIQISPTVMRLRESPYSFPELPRNTFHGLPGLLADSLPDKFGSAIIDAWLASQGRSPESFNSVERLCYIGQRGMGALEYEPALLEPATKSNIVEVAKLAELADRILNKRSSLAGMLNGADDKAALEDIIRVGTSAGGARAKAILAWNPVTNEFRSGQMDIGPDFEHWLLKFDGISNNRDKEIADPLGYGKIEFAYSLIAREIGIEMSECKLHHEGGRSHFMTKRFDRTKSRGKIHMQSLGALAHYDLNLAGGYSYEQALQTMKRVRLPMPDLEQQVMRAMLNVVGRNQDDHVKNIAFLMDRAGNWRLAPAFDVTYAYNPGGQWTNQHQMSINGKREDFTREDLITLAEKAGIKKNKSNAMLDHVIHVFRGWGDYAKTAQIEETTADKIKNSFRLDL